MSKYLNSLQLRTSLYHNIKTLLFISILAFTSQIKAQQIRIKAVGDIMMGSYTPTTVLPPRLGQEFIDSTAYLLDSADITFGNLEGVFVTKDIKPQKCSEKSREAKRCYEFGMPDTLSYALKGMHFSVMSMDNNHNSDYGWQGVQFTKTLLDKREISYAAKKEPIIIVIDSVKVGVIAFGHSSESFQVFDLNTVTSEIKKLDSLADIIIVSFHGGAEGLSAQHIKDTTEYFYGENRGNLIQFAHTAIDAGADLIIGHGPHVLRAIDAYKGKLICYSLGNFLTHGNVNITGVKGKGAIMDINLDSNTGDLISANINPTVQVARGIPVYDTSLEAINLIKTLTEEDFPNSEIKIDTKGHISFK